MCVCVCVCVHVYLRRIWVLIHQAVFTADHVFFVCWGTYVCSQVAVCVDVLWYEAWVSPTHLSSVAEHCALIELLGHLLFHPALDGY